MFLRSVSKLKKFLVSEEHEPVRICYTPTATCSSRTRMNKSCLENCVSSVKVI